MKLTIRRNYELKAMFLKIKNGDKWEMSREMHSEFRELNGWTDIKLCQPSNYVGSRMGLI
jgi:hypothetical protein